MKKNISIKKILIFLMMFLFSFSVFAWGSSSSSSSSGTSSGRSSSSGSSSSSSGSSSSSSSSSGSSGNSSGGTGSSSSGSSASSGSSSGTSSGSTSGSGTSSGSGDSGGSSDGGDSSGEGSSESGDNSNNNYSPSTISGISSAASSGGSLSGYSVGELSATINSLSKSEGNEAAISTIQAEIDARHNAVDAEVAEAENDLSECVKNMTQKQAELDAIESEYNKTVTENLSFLQDTDSLTAKDTSAAEKKSQETKAKYEAKKAEVENAKKAVNEAYNRYNEATKKAAAFYAECEKAGDPVRLSNGDFLYSSEDFEAQDFNEKFCIKRTLSSSGYSESFGKNWICPLDSRIVRCRMEDVSYFISELNKEIAIADESLEFANQYNTKHPRFPSDELEEKVELWTSWKNCDSEILSLLNEIQDKNNLADSRNIYAAYGRLSTKEKLLGTENVILFVDKEGDEYYFLYDSNGKWKNASDFVKGFEITGRRADGNPASDNDNSGGFIVSYKNGNSIYYDSYGILEKETDRNGNVTQYFSSGGKITSVKLKTGELININRNGNGFITSIAGNVSGTASYSYSGSILVSFTNKKNIRYKYSYDSDGDLIKITKADGKSVNITYGKNSDLNKKVVLKVVNENGWTDSYSYLPQQKTTEYTNPSGEKTVYKYNDNGNTIYVKTPAGIITKFENNSAGLISKMNENGVVKQFFYDSDNQLVKVSNDDGSAVCFEYDNFGELIKKTDEDGFYLKFNRDSKGNLTGNYYCGNLNGTCSYYSNGLLKSVNENGCEYSYEYNQFGSVTLRKIRLADGKILKESWSYDSKNRLVKYVDFSGREITYSYGDLTETENYYGLKKVIRYFDARNREIKTIEQDLISGKKIERTKVYDGCGNVLKVFLDGKLFCEYEYDSCARLTGFTKWNFNWNEDALFCVQGIKTDFTYNNDDFLVKVQKTVIEADSAEDSEEKAKFRAVDCESKYVLEREIYRETSGFSVVERTGKLKTVYEYDRNGRLKKVSGSDGFWKKYVFSKAGRLVSIEDSNENCVFYNYRTNSSKRIERKNQNEISAFYDFNQLGLLETATDFNGNKYDFIYDWNGNLTNEKGPGFVNEFTYDNSGNLLSRTFKDSENKICFSEEYKIDFSSATLIVLHTGEKFREIKYDCWNHPVKIADGKGTFFFEYDAAGNCVQEKNENLVKKYFYSPENVLSLCVIDEAYYEFNQFDLHNNLVYGEKSGNEILLRKYNSENLLEYEKDLFGNEKSYFYGENGNLEKITRNDSGKVEFSLNNTGKTVTQKINDDFFREYSFGIDGKIIEEKNPLSENKKYIYDKTGFLQEVQFNSGKIDKFSYDSTAKELKTTFNSGNQSVVKKNVLGNILEAKNSESELSFEYDTENHLVKQNDKEVGFELKNQFDSYGRKVSSESEYFDIEYEYDSSGNVTEIEEKKSGNRIKVKYNQQNLEVEREYSNGTILKTGYDDSGRIISKYGLNTNKELLFADLILYDESGKISAVIDKNGKFTKYAYDDKGRLEEVYYPYDEKFVLEAKKEFTDCGGFVKTDFPDGKNVVLSVEEVKLVEKILESQNLKEKIFVSESQKCWFEKYEYEKNGSVKSETNQFGKIAYKYDDNGKLCSKHCANSENGGFKFSWDDDGKLTKAENGFSTLVLKYGDIEKPVFISYENLNTDESWFRLFEYDSLGRLNDISENGTENYHFVYDGTSENLLFVTPVFENGASWKNYLSDLEIDSATDGKVKLSSDSNNASSEDFENQYRLISVDDADENNSYRVTEFSENESSVDVRIEDSDSKASDLIPDSAYVVMQIENESPVLIYSGTSESEVLLQNYRKNNVLLCNCNSEVLSEPCYDVWGKSIGNEDFSGYGFSKNLGKNYFGFYDFGKRIYCPEMKSFISEDLQKDGGNYYGYCVTDPVNYFDEDGNFKKGSAKSKSLLYAGAIGAFTEFSQAAIKSKGSDMGIPKSFNCADVSAAVDAAGAKASGMSDYSPMATDFTQAYDEGRTWDAMNSTQSKDYYSDSSGKNVTKTSSGYDSLTDSDVVTPGTVLVWSPDTEKGMNTGHTATVISRDYDENGNICGVVVIEGHLAEDNYTEVEYVYVNDNQSDVKNNHYNVKAWKGIFEGTYEIESNSYASKGSSCGG